MPTYSSVGHALQFGNNTPTVTIVGTDTDGYIIYDTSPSGTFYQFAPNTKYFALQIIFATPFILAPGVVINPANANTAAVMTAIPGLEFYVDQADVTVSYFKISGISSSTPLLGPQVLMWSYSVAGQQVGIGSGTVSSVATTARLTGGPITTTGTLDLATSGVTAGTKNGLTFDGYGRITATPTGHLTADGYTLDLSGGATSNQVLQYNGTSFVPATKTMFMGEVISSGTAGSVLFISSTGTLAQDNAVFNYNSTTHTLSAQNIYSLYVDAPLSIIGLSLGNINANAVNIGRSGINVTINGTMVLDGYAVKPAFTSPTDGQALAWSAANSAYIPTTISGGGATGPKVISLGFPLNSIVGTPSIAGANQFNPTDYTGVTTIKFHAVFSNGNSSVNTTVKLHDATNNVDIYTTTYSGSTAYQIVNQTLTVSTAGANTIANSSAIYEITIFVNSPLTGGTNFIQLYSAEFRVS